MKTVQERMGAIAKLRKDIEGHCMCFELDEDLSHYTVYFPEGYDVGGVTSSKSIGKENALEKLLIRIEKYWKDSFITGG